MPHTTYAYGFEAKVGEFAGGLSGRFTARESMRSFLLGLDRDGSVTSLSFADGPPGWAERSSAARRLATPHLFYDPLDDGMEYVWLSWEGIERHVMERLIGRRFERADFVPIPAFTCRARALGPGRGSPGMGHHVLKRRPDIKFEVQH